MRAEFNIQNIRCGGCANTITKKLTDVGFLVLEVNPEIKMVAVEISDESKKEEVVELLKSLGYPLAGEDSGIFDKAKSFVSCAIGKIS